MNPTIVTVVGNLVADPVQREMGDGVRVTDFRLACTPRVPDAAGGWADGRTSYYQVSAWRQLAANVAESLRRGERVVVVGRLGVDTWEDREGRTRSTVEITAEHVGHDLTFGTTRFTRVVRAATPPDERLEEASGAASSGEAAGEQRTAGPVAAQAG